MYKIIFIILFIVTLKGEVVHPQPPAIPPLQAWADHEVVYLYWTRDSEESIDPYTGYSDFEGYRLYRSEDGGKTWGGLWDKVFDYSGNQVGWNPIVQYDYTEKQDTSHCVYINKFDESTTGDATCKVCRGLTCNDDVTGVYVALGGCDMVINTFGQSCDLEFLGVKVENECPVSCGVTENEDGSSQMVRLVRGIDVSEYDPEALWVNIGKNTGIVRLYKDTDVIDGKEYIYALTAYDMGLSIYEVAFSDENGDGVFDADTVWSSSNPDSLLSPLGTALHSLESPRLYESFTDYNKNGTWDSGEPFSDENENEIWDARIDPINVVTITPGYLANNIEGFESRSVVDDFIQASTLNVGNGSAQATIINENEIVGGFYRFEIDACLDQDSFGDQYGSFPSGCRDSGDCAPGCLEKGDGNSFLYAYEIKDTISFEPKYTQSIDISAISDIDSVLFYKGLPGADTTIIGQVKLPIYTIENFKIDFITSKNLDWINNWTEWFNGFVFRVDNGFDHDDGIPSVAVTTAATKFVPSDLQDNDGNGYFSDGDHSDLLNRISVLIKHTNNAGLFNKSPNYSYRITFGGQDTVSTAYFTKPSESCYDGYTALPYRVDNITLNRNVFLSHYDKGIEYGYLEFDEIPRTDCNECGTTESSDPFCILGQCIYRTGWKNCQWDHNEYIKFKETVYSTNMIDGEEEQLLYLKIDFDQEEYFDYVGADITTLTNSWTEGENFDAGTILFYGSTAWSRRGMFYKTNQDIVNSIYPPDIWYDSNGDGDNDNPWKVLYPWADGEYIDIHPYKWFVDGDSWIVDLSVWGREKNILESDMESISVVPNPYIIESNYGESFGEHKLHFTKLPNACTISIYTITGELVNKIDHYNIYRGNVFWDLKNSSGDVVTPGLYIYAVEASSGEKYIGKFAVVR